MITNTEQSWVQNIFEGEPPEGYKDWFEWVSSKTKRGAFIRRAGPSDFRRPTKPAETDWDGYVDADDDQQEWGGEGLPPVGCECEYKTLDSEWWPVVITAVGKSNVLFLSYGVEICREIRSVQFRPIRTKWQKLREDLMEVIPHPGFNTKEQIAHAILVAGYRKPEND